MTEDTKWSRTEKAVARRAFDTAYQRECAAILAKLKEMAAAARGPEDIWRLHDLLSKRRRDIDRRYDYRYSVLIRVLGGMLAEGWIEASDLAGLSKDKTEVIKRTADFWARI